MLRLVCALGCALSLTACATLHDDLKHARAHYADARYESALVWLEAVQPHLTELDARGRAEFYYLRGMTAYRLGQRADALHYLGLAWAETREPDTQLEADRQRSLDRTLAKLAPPSVDFSPPRRR